MTKEERRAELFALLEAARQLLQDPGVDRKIRSETIAEVVRIIEQILAL